jgi:hypothetical protein
MPKNHLSPILWLLWLQLFYNYFFYCFDKKIGTNGLSIKNIIVSFYFFISIVKAGRLAL